MIREEDLELSDRAIRNVIDAYRWDFRWDHHGFWVREFMGGRLMVSENNFTVEHDGETVSYEVKGIHNVFKDHQLKRMIKELRKWDDYE